MAKNVKNIARVSLLVYTNNRFKDTVEDFLVCILWKKQVQKQSQLISAIVRLLMLGHADWSWLAMTAGNSPAFKSTLNKKRLPPFENVN